MEKFLKLGANGLWNVIIFVLSTCIPLFLFVFFVYAIRGFENYCWWKPYADTFFARDFNEEGYVRISPGMSSDEVKESIGEPFYEQYLDDKGQYLWYYTKDGKARIGDWAWIGREILFNSEMIVIEKREPVHYD